jgi:hypothetical protein
MNAVHVSPEFSKEVCYEPLSSDFGGEVSWER